MSSLTHIERQKLERELGMGGGYVLAFSNRTFEEFFWKVVGVRIYDSRFELGSGSKANRMRAFWDVATDAQVRLLCGGLIDGWDLYSNAPMPDSARALLRGLVARLGGGPVRSDPQANDDFPSIEDAVSTRLIARLLQLTSMPPQKRGYEFEAFLNDMFDAYALSPRASFRLVGEQIDGSFVLHDETYLLEAKWQNAPSGVGDLHTFEGKLREKASWSRGLFMSISGFSPEGIQAFGRGKRVICMDGFDLSEMLRLKLPLARILAAKVRKAAETGSPFIPVRELFIS